MAIVREVRTEVYCDICGEYVIGWKSDGIGVSKDSAEYYARQEGCTTGEKIICKSCRIRRRMEKCGLQKKHGAAGTDADGTCLGFGSGFDRQLDDEPVERCKRCIACTAFDWEAEKQRLSVEEKIRKRGRQ